jgi:integrase
MFDTKADARRWLNGLDVARTDGTYVDPVAGRRTVADYAAEWLAGRDGEHSTRYRERSALNRWVVGRLGYLQLDQLTPAVLRAWNVEVRDALSDSTVAYVRGRLRAMLATAVADRLLPRNPADEVEWARLDTERHDMVVLSVGEVDQLAAKIDPAYRALVLIGCFAGLRIGELVALRRADVDLDRCRVHVTRATSEIAGRLDEDRPTKTRAGVRSVPIPSAVAAQLRPLLDDLDPADHVVTTATGKVLRQSWFRRRYWLPAVEAIGRPGFRVHDMRHTAITLWIHAGADVMKVSRWAGHTNPGFTLRRYGHLYPSDDAEAMGTLDGMWRSVGAVVDLAAVRTRRAR